MEQTWKQAKAAFAAIAAPPIVWLLLFFLVPLAVIWAYSFGENTGPVTIDFTGTFANYARALEPLYLEIFWKSLDRRGADDAALPGHRLSGGAGDRVRFAEDEGVAAAADHAAVLDQSAHPHLRADRGVARERLHELHARMALEQCQRADDAGRPAAARRIRAADVALQQHRRGDRPRLRAPAVHGAAALFGARPHGSLADGGEPRSRRRASADDLVASSCRWRRRASRRAC